MKNSTLFAILSTTSAMAFSPAFADETIERNDYAAAIGNSIVNACEHLETDDGKISCIAQGVTASFTVATDMGKYLDEVIAPVNPFGAGLAKGDLIGSCFSAVNNFSGREYSGLDNYLDA